MRARLSAEAGPPQAVLRWPRRVLYRWLNRRSQRRSYTWPTFARLLRRFEVEMPKVMERTGGLVRELRRWAEEHVTGLGQIQLLGESHRPCGRARELT
jgi:hypothetical protein